jgi:spoIIIJ-associated protein
MAYDATQEPHEFIADDRSAAVAKACQFYGVEEGQLAISELQPGEVHGLGARCVVVALPRELVGRARRGGEHESRERDRGPRERGGRERGGRERGGRERGGRERGGRDRGGRERGRGRREAREPERESRESSDEEPVGPSVGEVKGELGEVGTFVCGVIERMELGPFSISESRDGELLVLQVSGAAAPRLSGPDGRAVDALQLLANQAAGRIEEEPPRVVLDVEGDADAREERLEKLAQRVARRARDTGRAVRLDPMNGKDRRTIHLALRDEEDVATMSTGEGPYRQVVVVPEGAPEFEEALRESEKAAQRGD